MLHRLIVRPIAFTLTWLALLSLSFGQDRAVRFERQVLTDQYYCDGVAGGDINADGHMDIVAGPFWYEGPKFTTAHSFYKPVPQPREPSPSNSMFTFVHDLNGDSWPDILVLGRVHKHVAMWYENPGSSHDSGTHDSGTTGSGIADGLWKSHFAFERVRGESPTVVDIDGDGGIELICHWEGRWGWIAPDDSDPVAPWHFHAIGEDEGWPQFYHGEGVGDVNGDGRLDLIINDGWYEQPATTNRDASVSQDGWTRADPLWKFHRRRFSQSRGGAQMFVDDIDGDGDSDVISAVDAHGWGLAWYEQKQVDSGVRFAERLMMGDRSQEKLFGAAFTQPHALALADIDGDGHRDIITGKRRWAHGPEGDIEPAAEPVVYWFRWTRSPEGTVRYVPHRVDADSGVGVQILATDVDGDSRVDVVTASKLGTFLFRNLAVD